MAKNENVQLAPDPIGVREVRTEALTPNPHNPRMLFDRAPLETLKLSIEKVGILVPLTIYRESKKQRYVILDGQRRWICAKELGLEKVPVNVVAEPSLVQNIVTMFQIHKLREDWELMPTALKLELLMSELDERSEKRLSVLTGLDQAVVSRCKKLLTFPKKYQDMMLDPDPRKREKADFFIELYAVRNDRTVNKMKWFKKDKFTMDMLRKYRSPVGSIKAVTDFRKIKQHVTNAAKVGRVDMISSRLENFSKKLEMPISELEIGSANIFAEAKRLTRDVEGLIDKVKVIDVRDYYGEQKMWATLNVLARTIDKKLKQLGWRATE